ncbi:MAG: rhodanese-like domain-containing protein [Bacteroidia bacterium]
MKTKLSIIILFALTIVAFAFNKIPFQNEKDPWTDKQLMQPADLAKIMNDPKATKPILLSIGFGAKIKGAVEMGAASEKEGIEKLKQELSKLPKDADIVIFCGCCPFEHCPNIRPAFKLLAEMKFTKYKLLNLSHNLKVDWIDKGYPMNE